MSDTKSKGGRPAGSRNKQRETVICTPPSCPKCGRSVSVNLKTVPVRVFHYEGQTAEGFEYDCIEYRNLVCECGQHLRVSTPRKKKG